MSDRPSDVPVEIEAARDPADVEVARTLFLEYQAELGVDLGFQDFDEELRTLPGDYTPPGGALLLALVNAAPAGCVAMRAIDASTCEMKRLHVRPAHRRAGVGRRLVGSLLSRASWAGYRRMSLDTLPGMAGAQRLYESLGFRDIEPYRPNPIAGSRFLGRDLLALPLITERLTLRPIVPEDAAPFFRLSREEALRRWLPSQAYRDLAEAEAVVVHLAAQAVSPGDPRRGPVVLAVEAARGGGPIGHVGFSPFGGEVEVGFALDREHQGRGLATEAVREACRWACAAFGLGQVLGIAAQHNAASHRVLERAGFVHREDRTLTFQGSDQIVRLYTWTSRARGL